MYYMIKNVHECNELRAKISIPKPVMDVIRERMELVEALYGAERDAYKDLGGYFLVCDSYMNDEEYQKLLETNRIRIVSEFEDELYREKDCVWVEALYLLSNDYGIEVFYPKKLS